MRDEQVHKTDNEEKSDSLKELQVIHNPHFYTDSEYHSVSAFSSIEYPTVVSRNQYGFTERTYKYRGPRDIDPKTRSGMAGMKSGDRGNKLTATFRRSFKFIYCAMNNEDSWIIHKRQRYSRYLESVWYIFNCFFLLVYQTQSIVNYTRSASPFYAAEFPAARTI